MNIFDVISNGMSSALVAMADSGGKWRQRGNAWQLNGYDCDLDLVTRFRIVRPHHLRACPLPARHEQWISAE
jgi:hypothetical protein